MNEFESLTKKGLQVFRGKEGWVKAVYVTAMIGLTLLGGYYVFPYAIMALENILYTLVLVIAVFVVGYVTFSPTFQRTVIYFLDNMILGLQNALIQSDPFNTAQNAIKKLKKRLEEMKGYMTNLRGSRDKLKNEIKTFEREREDDMRKAEFALKNGDKDLAVRFSNTAQRRLDSINRLTPILDRTTTLSSFIEQLYKRVDAKIGEAEDSLSIALREFNITEMSDLAIKAAQKAMSGDDMEMFTRSMDAISEQTYAMVGEVEFFMDTTRPLLEMDKITDAVQSEKALENLRAWMNSDTTIMDKDEKRQLALNAGDPNLFIGAGKGATPARATAKVAVGGKTGSSDVASKYGLDD